MKYCEKTKKICDLPSCNNCMMKRIDRKIIDYLRMRSELRKRIRIHQRK